VGRKLLSGFPADKSIFTATYEVGFLHRADESGIIADISG
jgi:hypothetical protein